MTKVFKRKKNLVWLVKNVGVVKLEEDNQLTHKVHICAMFTREFFEVERTTAFTSFCQQQNGRYPIFFSLANFLLFFFLMALESCHEMGFYNNE